MQLRAPDLLSCCVSVNNGVNEVVQKPLMPQIALAEAVDWSMIENRPKYCVSHTPSLEEATQNGKEVIISLSKGNARLGRFIINISTIVQAIEQGGDTVESSVIGKKLFQCLFLVVSGFH